VSDRAVRVGRERERERERERGGKDKEEDNMQDSSFAYTL
jgi:hypothetical protein